MLELGNQHRIGYYGLDGSDIISYRFAGRATTLAGLVGGRCSMEKAEMLAASFPKDMRPLSKLKKRNYFRVAQAWAHAHDL